MYGAAIGTYCKAGLWGKAVSALNEMLERGHKGRVRVNVGTFNAVIGGESMRGGKRSDELGRRETAGLSSEATMLLEQQLLCDSLRSSLNRSNVINTPIFATRFARRSLRRGS